MYEIPGFIEKEIYYKDTDQLKIDVIEISKQKLFSVERVYFLSTTHQSHVSGNHAHINQSQLFVLIKGHAKIKLINLRNEISFFTLEERGLYVPESHWIELTIEPESIVLCLASKSYDELKSIHNLDEFINLISSK